MKKMASVVIAALAVMMGMSLLSNAEEAKPAAKAQTMCPVMNGPVNKSLYVDYEGKRVYVCCGGCIATVKEDPAKYIKQLEDAGVVLDKAAE